DDVQKILQVLRSVDALPKFNDKLPAAIVKFDDRMVAQMTAQLDAFRKSHPEVLPFALALSAKRLKTSWQLIRLATKAAPTKS
ncbi:hypothetical protein WAC35_29080, partial [Klebsiella pneumoniae]|uniref:hypothetical protein n=1 Tax=Klebsiella pneumoniae TaxID=573 RepID=UPI003012F52A